LDLLGFIRPNRDFSMGYGESKQKNPVASQTLRQMSQMHFPLFLLSFLLGPAAWQSGLDSVIGKRLAQNSDYGK